MGWVGHDQEVGQPIIRVGSQIRVRDGFGEDTFRIVNAEVSDPGRHWISEDSPLATALLGHYSGETVKVRTPFGTQHVTVLSVE